MSQSCSLVLIHVCLVTLALPVLAPGRTLAEPPTTGAHVTDPALAARPAAGHVAFAVRAAGLVPTAETNAAAAPSAGPDFALVASAGADFALLSDGDDDTANSAEGLQALGSMRLFIGHDVWTEGAVSLALGYEAMVGYGRWNLSARSPVDAWLTRQSVGGVLRADFLSISITSGLVIAVPEEGRFVPVGWTLTTQIAITAGPVWIGIPWGVDVWPGLPVFSQVFGLNLGFTTM